MSDERMIEVAQELLGATKRGTLEWHRTDPAVSYYTQFPSGVVRIFPLGGSAHLALTVHNSSGNQVDSLEASIGEDAYRVLRELFDAAQDSFLKPDETIGGILRDLKKGPR